MKRGFTLLELIVILLSIGIVAAILYPVFQRPHPGIPKRGRCQSNLRMIGLGQMQYTQDWDEKFPPVSSAGNTFGWSDALQLYVKSTQIFQCPSEPIREQKTRSPRAVGFTDYWFNARLARLKIDKLIEPALTIMQGDGSDGRETTSARYAIRSLPVAWVNDSESPLYRHVDGMNFAFADGHVKWFKADKLTDLNLEAPPRRGNPTFAPR